MNRGEFIPIDILLEIFSRLSAKSIARFRCVSKFWTSMLSRPYFKELFLTKSSTQPRLLFALQRPDHELHFYSSPQPKNLYKKSSHIPSADFHMKFYVDHAWPQICGPVFGLICLSNVRISKEDEDRYPVICNLSTGKYVRLPHPGGDVGESFFGYDSIEKQFKVLFIDCSNEDELRNRILTLGSENVAWRTIQVPLPHCPSGGRIYINGVLYYLAYQDNVSIFCFDFRAETFMLLDKEFSFDDQPIKLINYKGKFGAIIWCWRRLNPYGKYNFEMSLFVLEDMEKQEWSKHDYTLWNDANASFSVSVVGVTTTGEFVLCKDYITEPFINPFDVFYFNPENNSLQSIRIPGSGANLEALEDGTRVVYTSIDYVEDLNFI